MTNQDIQRQPLFDLGQTVATPGALEALEQVGVSAVSLLRRHQSGDWGDLGDEDLAENNAALHRGSRLFSSYQITDAIKIWVITEADRSATTLLLPKEY
ncbi:MAG TPA: hypothetical protein VIF37_20455 [Methylobacter sp.]|jgi:hypothetical protein